MSRLPVLILLIVLSSSSVAAVFEVSIELPRKSVAEYHRPYVAVWIARPDQSVIANVAVWYQQDSGPEGDGDTWLKDMRQWWRRTGRQLALPIDGITGATRPPGVHQAVFPQLQDLEAGEYLLQIEVAREVGDRELLRIPFTWPQTDTIAITAEGTVEIGVVELKLGGIQ